MTAPAIPGARAIRQFIRENDLRACATCGKAGGGDPVAVAAIYSVMIEMPALNAYLCDCEPAP